EALLVDRLFPNNAGFRRDRYLDQDRRAAFDVEQPAAAALLVRRDAFEALSGFAAAFTPAWFEDVDLCARLLESGWRIRYVPEGRAKHVGGVTMQALFYRDFRPVYVRPDAAGAHARVVRGLLGFGWRSALIKEGRSS